MYVAMSKAKEAKHDLIDIRETSCSEKKKYKTNNKNEESVRCIDILIWSFPYRLLISDLRHTTVIYCIFVPVLDSLSEIPHSDAPSLGAPLEVSSRNFEVPIQRRTTFEVQFKIWLCLHKGGRPVAGVTGT